MKDGYVKMKISLHSLKLQTDKQFPHILDTEQNNASKDEQHRVLCLKGLSLTGTKGEGKKRKKALGRQACSQPDSLAFRKTNFLT